MTECSIGARAACVRLYAMYVGVLAASACAHPAPAHAVAHHRYALDMERPDAALAAELGSDVDRGMDRIERFFGAPFRRPIAVRVFDDRSHLDAHWGAVFHDPSFHAECWMVGVGTSSEFSILSPARWRAQGCEHDPADHAALAALIAHELVHTYHSQLNKVIDTDDDAAAALAWFVEGLAVYVSGQLADGHLAPASEAIRDGHAPTRLADAWTGKYRYGVSGSLVAFIDATRGRAMVQRLLLARTPGELLGMLGTDEPTLLKDWRAWATARNRAD